MPFKFGYFLPLVQFYINLLLRVVRLDSIVFFSIFPGNKVVKGSLHPNIASAIGSLFFLFLSIYIVRR